MAAPILIDGRAATRGQVGGVERWAQELVTRLPLIAPTNYRVVAPAARFAHRLGYPWEQVVLPIQAAKCDAPLILCPANLAPVASNRVVVVIHDAAPLRYPADYSRSYMAMQRLLLPRLVARSRAVITPSHFSRDELVELCAADPTKVHVVAPGVSDHFRVAADSTDALERFSLQRPYVITVASRVARKNLEVLDRSAERLADLGIDLVAVGGSRAEMVRPPAVGSIRDLGPMGDRDLAELYRSALAFVLPSKYEGYGLPVIEAMALGTAVVCSATTGLAEAAGGAALLVDPDDATAIAEALVSIASSEELRSSLIEKGYGRTAGLTWQKTAESVDLICKSLI